MTDQILITQWTITRPDTEQIPAVRMLGVIEEIRKSQHTITIGQMTTDTGRVIMATGRRRKIRVDMEEPMRMDTDPVRKILITDMEEPVPMSLPITDLLKMDMEDLMLLDTEARTMNPESGLIPMNLDIGQVVLPDMDMLPELRSNRWRIKTNTGRFGK